MARRVLVTFTLATVLAIAGCSGGSSGSPEPSSGASASAAASQGSGASPSPAASTAASVEPSSGGGTASAACDLVSASEAASILGVASTTQQPTAGEPSYCMYAGPDGGAVLATSFATSGGSAVMAVYRAEDGATKVDGIGDEAVFSPSTNTLFILKGDRMVGITAGAAGTEPDQRLELSKQVGEIAAGRM